MQATDDEAAHDSLPLQLSAMHDASSRAHSNFGSVPGDALVQSAPSSVTTAQSPHVAEGAEQTPLPSCRVWQLSLLQSAPVLHGLPWHRGQGPPQSTPTSSWFCTPSEQVGGSQVSVIGSQSVPATQSPVLEQVTRQDAWPPHTKFPGQLSGGSEDGQNVDEPSHVRAGARYADVHCGSPWTHVLSQEAGAQTTPLLAAHEPPPLQLSARHCESSASHSFRGSDPAAAGTHAVPSLVTT